MREKHRSPLLKRRVPRRYIRDSPRESPIRAKGEVGGTRERKTGSGGATRGSPDLARSADLVVGPLGLLLRGLPKGGPRRGKGTAI